MAMQAVIMEPFGRGCMLLCFALTFCSLTSLNHTMQYLSCALLGMPLH